MGRGFALAVLVVVCAGCGGSRRDPFVGLHRPLHIGRLAAQAHCPVSPVSKRVDFARFGIRRPGIGRGPVFPVMTPTLGVEFPPPLTTEWVTGGWGGQRVLWFVAPAYEGPVLIRGRRLDGRDPVRFERGDNPPAELRIGAHESGRWPIGTTTDAGQRYRRSYTRIRAPGCYAYQVDGTSFSYTIVFRAILT